MPFFPNANQQALMAQMFSGNQGMPIIPGRGGMAGNGGMQIPNAEPGGNATPIGPSFVGPDEQASRGVQIPAFQPAPNIGAGGPQSMAAGIPSDLVPPDGSDNGGGIDRERLIQALMRLRQGGMNY